MRLTKIINRAGLYLLVYTVMLLLMGNFIFSSDASTPPYLLPLAVNGHVILPPVNSMTQPNNNVYNLPKFASLAAARAYVDQQITLAGNATLTMSGKQPKYNESIVDNLMEAGFVSHAFGLGMQQQIDDAHGAYNQAWVATADYNGPGPTRLELVTWLLLSLMGTTAALVFFRMLRTFIKHEGGVVQIMARVCVYVRRRWDAAISREWLS